MGTTAEKGARVLQSIAEVQEGINNLGGSLTDQTPFKDFKAQLDNIYDNLPKTEYQEGTEINLGKTIKGKLDYENGVVGIGQSSQDSTQGYNILENKMADSVTSGGVTYTKRADGSVLVNGTANGTSFCVLTKENNTLALPTEKVFTIDSTFYHTPQDTSVLLMFRDMDGNYNNCRYMANKDIGLIYLQVLNGVTIDNLVVYPMIVNGSSEVKPFEPYTNGASPNPDYEQEIKSVTGTIEEVVSGINKLSSANAETKTNNDFSVTCNGNGEYVVNSIPSGTYRDVVFTLKSNYTIKNGDYLQINNDFADYRANIILKDTSNTAITTTITYNVTNRIWDLSGYAGQTIKYISIGFSNTAENKGTIKPLICNSSTQVPFEPYTTPTSYQLSLGDIELNAIGNYKDKLIYDVDNDKVYKLQNIKKVTFNGTETGWAYYHVAEGELFRYTRLLDNELDSTIVNYSNYYKGIPSTAVRSNNEFYINTTAGESAGGISIMDGRFTDVEDYKDWLSTHNLEIYYVLATPTLTEITDTTLINQVKALYNAHSNNGTTIITSYGDLPIIIKVRALKGE